MADLNIRVKRVLAMAKKNDHTTRPGGGDVEVAG